MLKNEKSSNSTFDEQSYFQVESALYPDKNVLTICIEMSFFKGELWPGSHF